MRRLSLCLIVLAAAVLPAFAAIPLTVSTNAAPPMWDNGQIVSSNVLDGMYVRLYGADAGQPITFLDAAKYAPVLTFMRPNASAGMHCYEVTFWLDLNSDKLVQANEESPHSAPSCGQASMALGKPDVVITVR